jgi:hypothetical protein
MMEDDTNQRCMHVKILAGGLVPIAKQQLTEEVYTEQLAP